VKRGDELAHWKQRDPIRRLREALIGAGLLGPEAADALEAAAVARVRAAVASARSAPYPAADAVARHLYASRRDGR
jgi:TPP-dependent pyruvate/acetoin dehydrogenase alpha subunit